jgi:hypothetical protein
VLERCSRTAFQELFIGCSALHEMASTFAFVLTDGNGRTEADHRLLIRSHCMRGKNKRQGSRRSLREARRAAEGAVPRKQGRISKVVNTSTDKDQTTALEGALGIPHSFPEEEPAQQSSQPVTLQRLPEHMTKYLATVPLATEIGKHSERLLSRGKQGGPFPLKARLTTSQ